MITGSSKVDMAIVVAVLISSIFVVGYLSKAKIAGKQLLFEKLEPGFIGSLVSASGTIFAGFLAFTVTSETLSIAKVNTDLAHRQAEDARRELNNIRRANAATELENLQMLDQFLERLVRALPGAGSGNLAGHSTYDLVEASASGALISLPGSSPGGFSVRAASLIQRLLAVKETAQNNFKRPIKDKNDVMKNIEQIGRIVENIVTEMKDLRTDIEAEIKRRQQQFEALPK